MSGTGSAKATGTMIVIVGPSGAGKDSLIDFARRRLSGDANVAFVRRVITRDADAGSEDHRAVSTSEFDRMRDAGEFAVYWQAHGLSYGIPADTLEAIAQGRTLVANGSRGAMSEFLQVYPKVLVIVVTAEPEIIARRLAMRGREDEEAISRRLQRSTQEWSITCDHTVIDNSGALDTAGAELVAIIRHVQGVRTAGYISEN